ncbi:MAG: hypothetical protein LBO65_06060 [Spirochaetaceae bacterium]|jgi:hypothetical protein|nr:hypothetical protein [Spirochaetaceae bacterium]
MLKKSLFLGAAALALLVLFAVTGCSNPSGETEYVDRIVSAEFDYPPGTVFVNGSTARGFDELLGQLGDNGVTHIAYQGTSLTFSDTLTIPTGKTVYLEDTTPTLLDQNIIVQPGASLVLVTDVATSDGPADTDPGKLLVKGVVDVYGSLIIGTNALDVADYHSESFQAIYTVIGERVSIKAGGTLALKAIDIRAPTDTSSHDRFTPAHAWAAAGQGHLTIGADNGNGVPDMGDDFLGTAYTVEYLLAGVSPSANRRYSVVTQGGTLPTPPVIPYGAAIITSAAITDTADHTLTVNGALMANNATFANITKLTISQVKTDNNSRVAGPEDYATAGALSADSATLAAAALIDIGDYGTFSSDSPAIVLPADSVITMGRSAAFKATNNTAGNTNTFDKLTKLFIGKASSVEIESSAATLTSLKKLELLDSASLLVPNGQVNYKLDDPVKPGSYASLMVGYDPEAEAEVVISGKTNMASPLTIPPKSTFTVEEGATLIFEENTATPTIVNLMKDVTTDSGYTEPPIVIKGNIVIGKNVTLNVPDPSTFNPLGDTSKLISFGPEGKFTLQSGSTAKMGTTTFVGKSDDANAIYQMTTTDAEVEISAGLLKLVKGTATLKENNPIQARDTLEINGTLVLDNAKTLSLLAGASASEGGARITGTGRVVTGTPDTDTGKYPTEIVGGPSGWQAKGAEYINLTGSANGITITAPGTTTTLSAQGPGAIIIQNPKASGTGTTLTIATNTTIELGGSNSAKAGQIILAGDGTDPGKITFATTTSVIQLGSTPSLTNACVNPVSIGGVDFTPGSLSIFTDNSTTIPYGPGKFIGAKPESGTDVTLAAGSDPDTGTILIDSTQTVGL